MPAFGPGDRLLAETRAMQQLSLEDAMSQGGGDAPMSGAVESVPWPAPSHTSRAGMPQFSAGVPAGSGVTPPLERPSEPATCALSGSKGPQDGVREESGSLQVTVMINGVPRKGVFNEQGEVVIQSESPKYFSMQEGGSKLPDAPEDGRNPFCPEAPTPFRAVAPGGPRQQHSASPIPPPPPPPVPHSVQRGAEQSVSGVIPNRLQRTTSPRRPSRSPNPSPPRNPYRASQSVNASPATPGGTRVPKHPPPLSPEKPQDVGRGEGGPSLDNGDAKDFRPGERTLWELPVLGPVTDVNPAMRFSDWVHRVTSYFNDLSPRGHEWWQQVLVEARAEYDRWCKALQCTNKRLASATLHVHVFCS